jgi:hypothetical protein
MNTGEALVSLVQNLFETAIHAGLEKFVHKSFQAEIAISSAIMNFAFGRFLVRWPRTHNQLSRRMYVGLWFLSRQSD